MFNTSKLRGRIVEKYLTLSGFAKAVGKELRFVSSYLNNQRFLTQKDIVEWAAALDISDNDIPLYFFVREVHETEQ